MGCLKTMQVGLFIWKWTTIQSVWGFFVMLSWPIDKQTIDLQAIGDDLPLIGRPYNAKREFTDFVYVYFLHHILLQRSKT